MAAKHHISIVGGSFAEKDGEEIYNTAVVFNPDGQMIGGHRKLHLFDVDIPGGITFTESETLSPGYSITTLDVPTRTGNVRMGLGICFDIRFPIQSLLMAAKGADILVYPAAFNTVTGPMHWHLLGRARALDTQCWLALCSPARHGDGYQAYGHSLVVDPWGRIKGELDHDGEGTLVCEVDLTECGTVRQAIPVRTAARTDLYSIKDNAQ
eukprot:gnl/Dysnectes_brevis/1342_a1506_2391.p1 GENE.gnl/Dysnectes_brevis/1342_a1506_2391~~gnl/Dysnectes_brevis/1342_a1506_2391.p1  ORF type:complete len:210 (+),score=49.73 gnl/Dysnectes_brevis/1342_a1506_2391:233-862(+)